MAEVEKTGSRKPAVVGLLVLLGSVLLFGAAFLLREKPSDPVPPAPVRPPAINVAKVMDEGTLTRSSPEEQFLNVTAHAKLKSNSLNAKDKDAETRRVLGRLQQIFTKMKELAVLHKKTNPTLYAAEMEKFKEELSQLMADAQAILKEWDAACLELLRMIKGEGDSVVKDRMGYLLRFAKRDVATPALVSMAESGSSADRKVALTALGEYRTAAAVNCLIKSGTMDPELELRERAIVGIGRSLATPSPESKQYQEAGWNALWGFAATGNESLVRAAAFEAYSLTPGLGEREQDLIKTVIRTEKDPLVLKPAESAFRHMAARNRAASDKASPEPRLQPK